MKFCDFLVVLAVIGLIIAGLANVIGVGYGLYLWASVGMLFKTALWKAFVVWMYMIFGGIGLFLIGTFCNK